MNQAKEDKEKFSFIEARDLTLAEWLSIVVIPSNKRDVKLFPDYCFPSDDHRNEYLADITKREQKEIKSLLRIFLMPTGFIGSDLERISAFLSRDRNAALQIEQVNRVRRGEPAWEGLTWVLDLLHRPKMAIDVIHAYLAAHFWWMPDWRIDGLFDAMAIIRAAYLEPVQPRELLLSLVPRDFEFLVALLFDHRDFDVSVTRSSRDGGYDIQLQSTIAGTAIINSR